MLFPLLPGPAKSHRRGASWGWVTGKLGKAPSPSASWGAEQGAWLSRFPFFPPLGVHGGSWQDGWGHPAAVGEGEREALTLALSQIPGKWEHQST